MRHVSILDCTLRDGGQRIQCKFREDEIKEITSGLLDANIDFVEVGYIKDASQVMYEGNSTIFNKIEQMESLLTYKEKNDSLFVAFTYYGEFNYEDLPDSDSTIIDGIRIGFKKEDWIENKEALLHCFNLVKNKGYKLFVQGVNTPSYTESEFYQLCEEMNVLLPYCFGIVDTFGSMIEEDLKKYFTILTNTISPKICINFHSHNNLQQSYRLAIALIAWNNKRYHLVLDTTLSGIGIGAGNLPTEQMIGYLNDCYEAGYLTEELEDIIRNNIEPMKYVF